MRWRLFRRRDTAAANVEGIVEGKCLGCGRPAPFFTVAVHPAGRARVLGVYHMTCPAVEDRCTACGDPIIPDTPTVTVSRGGQGGEGGAPVGAGGAGGAGGGPWGGRGGEGGAGGGKGKGRPGRDGQSGGVEVYHQGCAPEEWR